MIVSALEGLVATALADFLVVQGRATARSDPLRSSSWRLPRRNYASRSPGAVPDLVHTKSCGRCSLSSAQWGKPRAGDRSSIAAAVIAVLGYQWAFRGHQRGVVHRRLVDHGDRAGAAPPGAQSAERIFRRIADGARALRAETGCRARLGLMAMNAFLPRRSSR